MGQIDVTDAWLYKYMSIVDEAIINEIEKNVDYDYAFSDEFIEKWRGQSVKKNSYHFGIQFLSLEKVWQFLL